MNEVKCMSEEELRAHLKEMEKNKEELKFRRTESLERRKRRKTNRFTLRW